MPPRKRKQPEQEAPKAEEDSSEAAPREEPKQIETAATLEKAPAVAEGSDSEDEGPAQPKRRGVEKAQRFCPYLDTINRHALDFDFEKVCSVSNSHLNVYACLVCGKFFQGRSRGSPAYFHALENSHHVFIKLITERVYCIPDDYEVLDASLNDIKYVLNPTYTKEQVSQMNDEMKFCRGLDSSEYVAGVVGLNNVKRTDYINVVVQALQRVTPFRNFFMNRENYKPCTNLLALRFGELVRKMWNPRNFKGHVSPHELLQAVSVGSDKRYKFDTQSDPVDLLAWMLNTIHASLGGSKRPGSSVVHKAFLGNVHVETKPRAAIVSGNTSASAALTFAGHDIQSKDSPFLFLTLDLPAVPLYKDDQMRNIIPQVPLLTLLRKFDGLSVQEDLKGNRRRYRLMHMPRYLVLHMKRFIRNTQAHTEKNITIVNFPVKNLEMRDFVDGRCLERLGERTKYDLVANICHEGRADEGIYKVHVLHKPNQTWYEIQDLHVQEILPQMVAISEAYIQIYERQG